MKVLDLFCGLGGWSDGFSKEGFEVLGVEIKPEIAQLYKHPVIVQDVRTLKGTQFKKYDVIVGSPPCRDFSDLGRLWGHTWKRSPDPEGVGLSLVNAFLKIVKEAEPKFWLMENVKNLQKYIGDAVFCSYLGINKMFRCFWGKFPYFLVFQSMNKFVYTGLHRYQRNKTEFLKSKFWSEKTNYTKWERAKIPLIISQTLAHAIKEKLR